MQSAGGCHRPLSRGLSAKLTGGCRLTLLACITSQVLAGVDSRIVLHLRLGMYCGHKLSAHVLDLAFVALLFGHFFHLHSPFF